MDEEMFLSFKSKITIDGYSIGNLYPNPFNASTKFYITLEMRIMLTQPCMICRDV